MFLLKKIILSLVLPPFSLVLLVCVGLLLARYRPRLGKLLIGISLFGIVVLSTPWVAGSLIQSLQKFPPISDDQLAKCQAIVVLGGGIYREAPEYRRDTVGNVSLERLRYALHLGRISGLPVLATGGAPESGTAEALAMRNSAETDFGREIKWIEDQSLDTSSSAHLSAQILKRHDIQRIALVSNAWHLPRAVANFEAAGLTVVPAPMGFSVSTNDFGGFLPSANALSVSSRVFHEWLGIMASHFRAI
ncbi:YdcF family protein [uncultured Propionivibrio sp.]|uniref:YdcF family protein n=1 Tax=uncultured Propionivibrio sp. TaxID=426737 RepID=UPI0029C0563F|nr:YdcF family protein [uncultured Propionivibrio sp.]